MTLRTRQPFSRSREPSDFHKEARDRFGPAGATPTRGLALAFACVLISGCRSVEPSHTLGSVPAGGNVKTVRSLSVVKQSAPVVVQGEMIEKCPVAGCWFVLKDKTGVVRVDTKGAGFVVTEVPLHSQLTVAGTLTPGAQPGIAASGVRY